MSDAYYSIDLPDVVAEVAALFERYETALVNNDTAVLNELFWNAPQTLRYGVAENLYGYAAIEQFRGARSPVGLGRRVSKKVITTFGRDFAIANCEFERGGRNGRQSQTWLRTPHGWRIVAAHISMCDSGTPGSASVPSRLSDLESPTAC